MKKILLATATPGTVFSETVDCIAQVCQTPDVQIVTWKTCGVYVFKQQNLFAAKTIEMECDYLFLVENDMVFPADILTRLLAHDLDIVACDYPVKPMRGKSTLMARDENLKLVGMRDGLVKVRRAPTGLMLIKTAALKKLPYRQWFAHEWVDDEYEIDGKMGAYLGNDPHFNEECAKAGIETWIDYDLSKEIEHIGMRSFTWKDTI